MQLYFLGEKRPKYENLTNLKHDSHCNTVHFKVCNKFSVYTCMLIYMHISHFPFGNLKNSKVENFFNLKTR